MKKILLPAVAFTACICMHAHAQNNLFYHKVSGAGNAAAAVNSAGFSGTGANMDVVCHRIIWAVNPNSATKTITGRVTTLFRTLDSNVSTISFDLNKASFSNNSLLVSWHGIACAKSFPASGAVNVMTINLPSVIKNAGTLDSVTISYSGVPPARNGLAEGFQRATYTDINRVRQTYTSTLSESYEDRDWWPCKADMQDKIDSMDIQVNVPWSGRDTFWVATNGRMTDSAISGTTRIFKFKTRYPIASYLVCLAVAKYNRYYRSVNINGATVPVVYNLLAGKSAGYYTNAVAAMDRVNQLLVAFSNRFGPYPFALEKHGFYDGLLGAGGMEHQTFSGIASSALTSIPTLAHELMHQWFGDHVGFATWNDLWLAEGFARYAEALAGELVPSLGIDPVGFRRSIKSAALSLSSQSAWIPDAGIGSSNLIWGSSYGSTVYERGAMIVSMLRTLCGDDIFYKSLAIYQRSMAGRAANADSLKAYFNGLLNTDISDFFNDYAGGSGSGSTAIGGVGNPVYSIKWNKPSANALTLGVNTQARTAGSNVAYFNGPVVVRVTGATAAQDTTIVFYDWGNGNLSYAGNGLSAPVAGNLLRYSLSFTPVTVIYDDQARTLSTGTTVFDPALLEITRAGNSLGIDLAQTGKKILRNDWQQQYPAEAPLHKGLSVYR